MGGKGVKVTTPPRGRRHQLGTDKALCERQLWPSRGAKGFLSRDGGAHVQNAGPQLPLPRRGLQLPSLCNLPLKALPSLTPSNLPCRSRYAPSSMNPGLSREHLVPILPTHLRTATPHVWKFLSAHREAPRELLSHKASSCITAALGTSPI